MNSSFKWKLWVIAGSILLGLYALAPTLFGFAKLRETLEAEEKPLPWHLNFFPKKGINLGLDLRGGIYVEMDVLVEEGVKLKLDILAQEIARELKREGAEPASWEQGEDHRRLRFDFKAEGEATKGLRAVEKFYGDKFEKSEAEGARLQLFLKASYLSDLRQDILSQAVQAVRNRIDRYGLTEPIVQRQGERRIVVELPGVKDPDRALKIIQQAGKLEFKLVNESVGTAQIGDWIAEVRAANNLPAAYDAEDVARLNELLKEKIPAGSEIAFEIKRDPATGKIIQAIPYVLGSTVYVTGEMLKNAQVQYDQRNSKPYVSVSFNPEGAQNFADLTKAHVKENLAILLDGNVMSAPEIKEPILNGECRIDLGSGFDRNQTVREAKDLTLVLQEGALPARLKEATKSVVGPTLGADSIQKSLKSILVAMGVVALFMIAYYNLSGFVANFALFMNTLFTFAALATFQATLTLPGMAGIALTIGMAVDANILIFERIREELNAGRNPRESVAAGYENALRAIIDSNLTTIIVGIILYQFGTGPIRGFAVTLMIGLVCNLFTAVFMTRVLYDYFTVQRRVERLSI